MFIHYKLFRSKNNEVFDEGKVQFNITSDEHLIALDDIITKIMSDYINSTTEVKKYGIAYVDNMELCYIEITDDDTLDLDKDTFLNCLNTINPNWKVKWSKAQLSLK